MAKKYDATVFIGRFSPLHKGHEHIIKNALQYSDTVIVIVGSSFTPRDLRNPFTFEERAYMIQSYMIHAAFPRENIKVLPAVDYPYNDSKWIAQIQKIVSSCVDEDAKIALIGHQKDETSYYLNLFPNYDSIAIQNIDGISSTDIRENIFTNNEISSYVKTKVNQETFKFLEFFNNNGIFDPLRKEYDMINQYKKAWESAPYPPTFVTVDSLVVQSGNILLVKRGAMPGKGLWALPGGFLNQNETFLEGAIRELKEETKLKVPVPVLKGSIKYSDVFDYPKRSLRGRTITKAYVFDLGMQTPLPKVKGSDDAINAKWVPFNQIDRQKMFEDHFGIIDYYYNIDMRGS